MQPVQHGTTPRAPLDGLFVSRPNLAPLCSAPIVPKERLESGDSIQLLRVGGRDIASWQGVTSSVTTLVASGGPVDVDVMLLTGDLRRIELRRFDALTLWPGTLYRATGENSDLLVMDRSFTRALAMAKDLNQPYSPPASGLLLSSDLGACRVEDGHYITLSPEVSPGFELRRIEGFTWNIAHYHESFSEAYHVAQGSLKVRLSWHRSGESLEKTLNAGDTAVIPQNVVHHVTSGSPDNVVHVAYWPRFLGDSGDLHHP